MKTSRLLSWLFISLFIISGIHEMNARSAMPQPDFAFPQRVSKQAEKDLKSAIRDNNGPLTLRALMDYGLAQSLVDTDNLPEILKQMQSLRSDSRISDASRAMIALLQATVYNQLYSKDRWNYDRRNLPLTPLPQNYDEWSGEQFRNRIQGLTDTALSYSSTLKSIPVAEWSSVLDMQDSDTKCFPTLYDFVAYRAIELLKSNGRFNALFSINWLCRYTVYTQLQFPYTSPLAQRILGLYQDLLRFHADDPYALIYADIERLQFVSNKVSDQNSARSSLFDLLMQLYDQYSVCEFSGYILQRSSSWANSLEQQQLLYDKAGQFLKNHPSAGRLAESVKGMRERLARRNVDAEYCSTVVPGGTLKVKVRSKNAPSANIGLYRVPDGSVTASDFYYNRRRGTSAPTLIASQKVSFTHDHTLFEADTTLSFTVPVIGRYVIQPLLSGSEYPTQRGAAIIRCTGITLISGTNTVLAADPLTGAPISGVKVALNDYKNQTLKTVITGTDGLAYVPTMDRVSYLTGTKGADNVSYGQYNSWNNNEWEYTSRIFTDLPIYHPGDTVRFTAIVYRFDRENRQQLCASMKVQASLWDANYQQTDTMSLTTDGFGRVEGRFAIPKEGLTGDFSIEVESDDSDDDISFSESRSFTVSDYKLPTFEIKDLQTQRGVPATGDVTITGRVLTYSGFPMADTKVTLDLSVSKHLWWSYAPDDSFYTTDTVTDADGNFSIELPARLLADAPISEGLFTASFTALSATGESQSGSTCFTQGPAYSIVSAIPDVFDISAATLRLPVKVINVMDNPVSQRVHYRLLRDKEEIYSGSFMSDNPDVDWKEVPSGRYDIEFSLADSTLANPATASGKILYRPDDRMPPVETNLWTPVTNILASRGFKVEIPYGTTAGHAHILATVWNNDTIVSRKWLEPEIGNHKFAVDMPSDGSELNVTFAIVSGYRFDNATISIYPKDVARSLDVRIESFRDRIVPGDHETWTITVADNLGIPQSSAVILDMYAKAITQLAEPDWRLNFERYYNYWRFSWNRPQVLNRVTTGIWSSYINYKQFRISNPDWQLYGNSFIAPRGIRIRGRNAMMLNSVREHKEEVAVEEEADMAYPETKKAALTGSVAAVVEPVLYGASASDASLEEVVVTGYGVNSSADAGNADVEERQNEADTYRMPELPIALFEPMLTTDAHGHLEYSFTAPDANTTWQLCALAFSQDMLTGSIAREIISSKPVMVQPNLPRFLRTGDKAVIKASVMNNTDTTMVITSRIDIFEPSTGHIWDVRDFTDTIAGHRSAVVEIEVAAPDNDPMLGFRVRALSGRYADGEQALIEILPSSTPVIETEPFYMAPDSTDLSVRLPRMPADARVTLQFCQNPAWYCVTALPGLRTDDARSALSASAAIFSAAIADGLLKSQPELARAIHYWQNSDRSDSTLVSMLEQNQDLKTVLLSATPWMMDARSQTERMTRLSLLFDRKAIASTYTDNIRLLTKLKRGSGGWGWIEQSTEPSLWITYNVLGMMGRLRQLGWLPDNTQLRAMIAEAVAYIDDYNAREFARYPKADYSEYVLTRDYFTDIRQSTAAKRVTSATVQRLISEWKNQSAPVKAISAIILNNHGYNATARQAIESLREFAKTSPNQGMWWPSLNDYTVWSMGKIGATSIILDAFHAVEPGCADIDRIRQWLILQKEAKDWGTSVTTSDAIASILTSGSRWTVPAHEAVITLGDHRIEPSRTDALTGYFRNDISSLQPSGSTLSIVKAPAGPAWGAVYCQYTGVMKDVKAQSCEAVSIDKQMFVQRSTPEGMIWEPASEIRVGDRVKVQLTIRSTRDMDYVAIIDDRAAALEPIEQLPEPIYSEGLCFYRENRDASTRMFVTRMPKGTYLLTYELFANNAGTYASGIASLQSQYAPQLSAHSSGTILTVSE